MKTCFPFWINYRVLQTTMINWISLKKEEEKKEEEGEKRFSQLWCDKNSILNWNTQYPRDSFKKFSNKQLTANGSRDESKSARVKTDRRSVARNQLKSGRETSIESLTGGEKKNGKKRIAMWQTLVGVANMADIDLEIQQRYVFHVPSNRIETRKNPVDRLPPT